MNFFHRSRGHFPNAQSAAQDQARNVDREKADEIEHRYETAIAYWSANHDCVSYDYSGEQFDRFYALKAAQGDVRIAKCLAYGQFIYDMGLINEGVVLP